METPGASSTQTEGLSESLNLGHYLHVVFERRWLVVTAFISVLILCLIYLARAVPIYQASARLQINKESEGVLNVRDMISGSTQDHDYLQTQYKNLQSRTLLEVVARRAKVDQDPRYATAFDKVAALSRDVSIAPLRLSRLVDILVLHPDPKRAAEIANTIAETFIQRNFDQKMGRLTNALTYLRDEANRLELDVERSERDLKDYRDAKKMLSLEDSQNVVLQAYKQAKLNFDAAESEAASSRRVADEVRKANATGTTMDALPQVVNHQLVQKLKGDLAAQESGLAALTNRYGPRHQLVSAALDQIARNREALRNASQEIVASILLSAEQAESKRESMRTILKDAELRQTELNELKINYEVLARKAEKNKELYTLVLKAMKETQLSQNDKTQNMLLVDPAVPQSKPVRPRVVLTVLLGILGGLAAGVALAFFVNYLDDSIKSQDDIESYLKLPFLGYVPNIKTNSVVERDLQSHTQPQSTSAEGFRTVRAAISLSPKADRYITLSVTSTIPSEGKSLVASNLAIVTAQTGLKTLLVDADLRRPSVHKAFQLQSPVGLSAYLQEKVGNIDEIVHATEVAHLDVICCGAIPSNPSELAGSRRMRTFLQEARSKYDRIVLDCPPVSAVSDPLVIASMSDGVVFVTKFNKIRREHARRSVQRVQDAGIHLVGVVINDIDFEGKDSYYYSYYYYQNRYYASHYKSEGKPGSPGKPPVSGGKPAA